MAPAPVLLEPQDQKRDLAFSKALHGKSAQGRAGLLTVLRKDFEAQKAAVSEYFKYWGPKDETEQTRVERRSEYATITRQYYNLVTDLYEAAWGQSFHFACFHKNETLREAITRHEHYLALATGIRGDMKVLDAGCGVGGPARTIQKFTDAHITGLNNNDYQIERAKRYTEREGLSNRLEFVKGDFMQMPFADNTFDAAYAIEATMHGSSLEGVYREIFRVVKPGGRVGIYEWVMKDKYNDADKHHRAIRFGIEAGSGISGMMTASDCVAAFRAAGFELHSHGDVSEQNWHAPWWYPIAGDLKYAKGLSDMLSVLRMTWICRTVVHRFIGALEWLGLAPKGVQKTLDVLAASADCLVEASKEDLMTPMYLLVGKKPEAAA